MPAPAKTVAGRFFEDFAVGQTLRHATPRTLHSGDAALYSALYGSRFAAPSAETFARKIGYLASPIDDLLAFHVVFGKTVPDVSINAVANLGYADGRFLRTVYPGDTLNAISRGDRPQGKLQSPERRRLRAHARLQPARRDGAGLCPLGHGAQARRRGAGARAARSPNFPPRVAPERLGAACPAIDVAGYDFALAGSPHRLGDYASGERIDHVDGVTVEEAEHQMATRLYQNTAKVHFNQFSEGQGRFGRRLIYGGHVISLARALSFNGLANAFHVAAINGGPPCRAAVRGRYGVRLERDTGSAPLPGRDDVGALRVRLVATKNRPCADFPFREGDGYAPSVVLDFDIWVLLPR